MTNDGRVHTRGRALCAVLATAFGALAGVALTPSPRRAQAQEAPELHLGEQLGMRFGKRLRPDDVRRFLPSLRDVESGQDVAFDAEIGRFVFDRATARRVVVRPEAVTEWLMLTRDLGVSAATRAARRRLDRIERRGTRGRLARLERSLGGFLSSTPRPFRLDADGWRVFPADPSERRAVDRVTFRVAGRPDDWIAARAGDDEALGRLTEAERFTVATAPAGFPYPTTSLFRVREHRRVLVDRGRRNELLVLPRLPSRVDLADASLTPGRSVEIAASATGPVRPFLGSRWSGELPFVGGRLVFGVRSALPLSGSDTRSGRERGGTPRVVDCTPPPGDTWVSPDTDWEVPDDLPVGAPDEGRSFVFRLRFDRPLDPRFVTSADVQLYLEQSGLSVEPGESPALTAVPATVELQQSQLGRVEVSLRPEARLADDARYRVIVFGSVRALDGSSLERPYQFHFSTAP